MRYALALIASIVTGCVFTADYQPPDGHPAKTTATDLTPPSGADPLAIQARPIECSANPHEGMNHGDHTNYQIDQEMSGQTEVATGDYPMTTCPVTGAELGTMGSPIDVVLGNRVIRVCCAGCVGTVKADPEKYLRILGEAATTQSGERGHGMHHEGGN